MVAFLCGAGSGDRGVSFRFQIENEIENESRRGVRGGGGPGGLRFQIRIQNEIENENRLTAQIIPI